MSTLAGLLVGVLAIGEPPVAAPTEPAPAAGAPTSADYVATLVVQSDAVAYAQLAPSLRVRVPDATLLEYGDEAFAAVEGKPFTYVEVLGSDTVALTIVLSDGRGYVRRFAPDPEDRTRSIATMIANTLVAIAEEQVEPDRRDAEIPPVRRPKSQQPAPAEPVATKPVATAPPPRPDAGTIAPPPSSELGLSFPAGVAVGLAPGSVTGFAGGGGALRVELRAPVGAVLVLGLRALGRANDGYGLARVRIQLGGGYDFRRGRFALLVVGGPTVEPWVTARAGASLRPAALGTAQRSPLIGVAASVSPGVVLKANDRVSVRLAGFVELAGSAMSSGGVARVVREREDGSLAEVFTLGGLEISVGVELGMWFRLRPAGASRPRATASE